MTDFAHVEPHQAEIHDTLINWSLWVKPGHPSYMHPMWAKSRSNAWQWHVPEHRPTCDILKAQRTEKAVSKLPEKHRYAVRWCYVHRGHPAKAAKKAGVTIDGLYKLVRDGRQMLIDRVNTYANSD